MVVVGEEGVDDEKKCMEGEVQRERRDKKEEGNRKREEKKEVEEGRG